MTQYKTIQTSGVIAVMQKAFKNGYQSNDKDWINFGQGSPELGDIPGDFVRKTHIEIDNYTGYAPVGGLKELRQLVADYYNHNFRQKKDSKYTWENICITTGGRTSLTKVLSIIKTTKMGYLSPDYASYAGALGLFKDINSTPIFLDPKNGFQLSNQHLLEQMKKEKIDSFLLSNPSNPTGQLVEGLDLEKLINYCEKENITLIHDEFYSRFVFKDDYFGKAISASEFIENSEDDVFLIDGMTKSWRYPGFRLAWVVGPKTQIKEIIKASSFIDGGSSHPIQMAAIEHLKEASKIGYTSSNRALQSTFKEKRDILAKALSKVNIRVNHIPEGTFYMFGDVSKLGSDKNTGDKFLDFMIQNKMIIVPGKYFDINPNEARKDIKYQNMVRFSYGPEKNIVEQGAQRHVNLLS